MILRFVSVFALILTPVFATAAYAMPADTVSEVLQVDDQGNVLRTLAIPDAVPDRPAAHLEPDSLCLDDGMICLSLAMEDQNFLVVQDRNLEKTDPKANKRLPLTGDYSENASLRLWNLYIERGSEGTWGKIVGVVETQREGYSGGQASASILHLYALDHTTHPQPVFREVFSAPFNAEKNFRACFSDDDIDRRAGACADIYKFEAIVTLWPEASGEWPSLTYGASASHYPRNIVMGEDNSVREMTEDDLVEQADEACTFKQPVRFNPLVRRYEFGAIGPDCSDYLFR